MTNEYNGSGENLAKARPVRRLAFCIKVSIAIRCRPWRCELSFFGFAPRGGTGLFHRSRIQQQI